MTTDPDNPEELISVPSEIEAAAIVAMLTEQGIRASTTGGYTAGFRAEAPGQVNVVVRHADVEQAKLALAATAGKQTDVNWSQVDVGEPEGE